MNAKKRLIALTLAAAAAISAACASVEKQGASETRGPVIAGEHPNSKIPAGHEDPVIAAEPPNPIIAELPDRDIALYAAADGVHRGYRHRKLGWKLLDAMIRFCVAHQGRYIETFTCDLPEYASARRLFERNGFQLMCLLPEYYYPGEGKLLYLKLLHAS